MHDVIGRGPDLVWDCSDSWQVSVFSVRRESAGDVRAWTVPAIPTSEGSFTCDVAATTGMKSVYVIATHDVRGEVLEHGPFTVTHGDAQAATITQRASPAAPVVASSGQPGQKVKVGIVEDGLYFLDSATIAGSLIGFTQQDVETFIGGTNLLVSCGGRDVSWLPANGNTGVTFYAEGIDSRYTAQNEYWILPLPGQSMATRTGPSPGVGDPLLVYTNVIHREVDTWDRPMSYFSDPEADFWVWYFMYPGIPAYETATEQFVVDAIPAPGGTGGVFTTVSVMLHGGTDIDPAPEHSARLTLNGNQFASNSWDGFGPRYIEVDILEGVVPGTNTLIEHASKTSAMGPGDYSYHYFDWYNVSYPRYYVATDDDLWCHGADTNVIVISGFTSTNIDVFDITDPRQPVRLRDTFIDAGTNSDYRVSFRSASSSNQYYAVAERLRTPDEIRGRSPMGLTSPTNRGDYVVIVAPGFSAAVQPLVEQRQNQGLDTMVVPIEDVYDACSHGVVTPWAIRSLLTNAASSWADAPRYVVLAGSGSYDYLDRKGAGDCMIPAPTAAVAGYGLRTSDALLCDLSGGLAPEVALGRLHCQTTQELAGVVAKTLAYESGGAWRETVHLTADLLDPEAGDFAYSCDVVATQVDAAYAVETNYYDDIGRQNTHDGLVSGINSGALIAAYFGHGNPDQLGSAGKTILAESDLPSFTNATRAPVMLAMTCDFAYFGSPNKDRLGESLVNRSAGGVTALWGCAAPTYNIASERMAESVVEHIFSGRSVRLGDALVAGLADYEDGGSLPSVLSSMTLLGDPATVLAPEPYSYAVWRRATFSTTNATNAVVSDPYADPDEDGDINLVEFIQDSNPMVSATGSHFMAYLETEEQGPGNYVDFATLEFRRRKWLEGYEVRVERTFDLPGGTWSHGLGVSQEREVLDINDVVEDVKTRVFPPLPVNLPLFVRLAIMETD